ncbi:hypothetical protein L208DRAFT_1289762 [Tricholoma matsutake]|nr:hypothetical protein L208DRAFT_1289762 [Tricholoma matsutake 945]
MISTTLFFLLLCSSTLTFASDTSSWRRVTASSSSRNVPPQGYYNPADKGGSMLDQVPDTIPPGQGEPLNVIISGASDPAVLLSSQVGGGLLNYYLSLGFATECLGQHLGVHQGANLGDGNGVQNETAVIRWDYGDPAVGTCKETIEGGNHFRYWIQNGAAANSGAIFMAVSYEEPLAGMFFVLPPSLPDFSAGRDWLVGNATQSTIPQNPTTSMTFSGSTSFAGYIYKTSAILVSGLLPNTSIGVNHNTTVGVNGANAIDGLVAVLTVSITQQPQTTTSVI